MKSCFRRMVVKVGSNVLTRSDGSLDVARMMALADQIAELRRRGMEIILVSSGAVAAGRALLSPQATLDSVAERQLYSSVGQVRLIHWYYELFREHGIDIGQVLTMKECFATRRLYLNQRDCIEVMLANKVLPIVNENDTVSVSELMFTDNDELSGLVAAMTNAECLILLSNVDGLYDGAPTASSAKLIPTVTHDMDCTFDVDSSHSKFGRGGMRTKAAIARKVADEGIRVIIANGQTPDILLNIIDNETWKITGEGMPRGKDIRYTCFLPAPRPASDLKRWVAHSEGFAKGGLHLCQEAAERLLSDEVTSVLPADIKDTEGEFEPDDLVNIYAPDGRRIGVGKSEYNASEVRRRMGLEKQDPVVHYDYLYIE